jgi:hypothetical protein
MQCRAEAENKLRIEANYTYAIRMAIGQPLDYSRFPGSAKADSFAP